MKKYIRVFTVITVTLFVVSNAFAAPRRRNIVPSVNLPVFNQELHISGTLAPAFLAPAGIFLPSPQVEFFVIPNLAVGLDFSYGYTEGSVWAIAVDFATLKYVIKPSSSSRFSFFLKTGFGMAIGISGGSSAFSFDWLFSGGMNYWVTKLVGFTIATETHTDRGDANGTFHMLRLGVTVALGL